jgi:hypothetical protein
VKRAAPVTRTIEVLLGAMLVGSQSGIHNSLSKKGCLLCLVACRIVVVVNCCM